MKSGSTSLHGLLAQHPQLFMCEPKEPAFFSRMERYELGLDSYRKLFERAQPGQLCAESSTCYSRYPHYGEVPARIFEHLPKAKLIYILRHPVDRMYSHYRHRMIERYIQKTAAVLPFERAIEESREYHDASSYLMQIEKFLEFYDRSSLLVLTTEALEAEQEKTVTMVHRFLGVEPIAPVDAGAENQFDDRFARNEARSRFERARNRGPVRALAAVVPSGLRPHLRKAASWVTGLGSRRAKAAFQAQLTPLTRATRERLVAEFVEPNRRLEEFLGEPLPASWRA